MSRANACPGDAVLAEYSLISSAAICRTALRARPLVLAQSAPPSRCRLGASPRRAFYEVTLPLSLPGILAGSLLVFSLAISSFVVPILLGGFKVQVLPMIVYEQVLSVFDWPFGAANAFVLLIISIALIAGYIRLTERALRGIA